MKGQLRKNNQLGEETVWAIVTKDKYVGLGIVLRKQSETSGEGDGRVGGGGVDVKDVKDDPYQTQ